MKEKKKINVHRIKLNQLTMIMGLSGCGKTTLLKYLAKKIYEQERKRRCSTSKNCVQSLRG